MVVKSQGKLDDFVRVELKLINIGDGLPERSDVKFRGVIVGMVSGVTPSQHGQPNVVHVNIQPQFAAQIPDNVTARVVPANIFAVSAVQLVQNGDGARPIRSGDVVLEDQTLPTVLFQNVLAKLRQLLKGRHLDEPVAPVHPGGLPAVRRDGGAELQDRTRNPDRARPQARPGIDGDGDPTVGDREPSQHCAATLFGADRA